MKKMFFAICLFISFIANAQVKSGIIKYEMVTSFAGAAKNSDKQIPEAILAMFPSEIKNNKQLTFNETKALYENVVPIKSKSDEEEEPQEASGGITFKINRVGDGSGSKEKTYVDLVQNQMIETKSFFGKDFLVTTDSINKVQWKPTGKQKLILNYPCYEAITLGNVKGKKDTISAWYTPAISPKCGPMGYSNLPGMILQLKMGEVTSIMAIEVIEKEIRDVEIMKPNEGKKVTATEFDEINEKKMKEMGIEKGKPRVIMHSSSDMQ